ENALFEAIDKGVGVMLFGSMKNASQKLLDAVGVRLTDEALSGDLTIETSLPLDEAEIGTYSHHLSHPALVSGGGIMEIPTGGTTITAWAEQNGTKRAYAAWNGEKHLAWVRGSFPHVSEKRGALPQLLKPSVSFPTAQLLRASMALFGYPITFSCYDIDDNLPIVMLSKCRGALWINEFSKDATVKMHIGTPDGIPVFDNCEFIAEHNLGHYQTQRWIHTEARVFIRQENRSKITIKKNNIETYINCDEMYDITGLSNASVVVYPSAGGIVEIRQRVPNYAEPDIPVHYDEENGCFSAEHVTGNIRVFWQEHDRIGDYIPMDFIHHSDYTSDTPANITRKQ
ncbi:MAG: hypothetical protein MJ175_04055, partial [Clostridia bacterium]|nr:hypothetical protein [Clostridia bacterium]